jgi:hypothetical protein
VRTVQPMGWSGLVNGKLLAAAAGELDVLIAPNNKLKSFLPLVGRQVKLASLYAPNQVLC